MSAPGNPRATLQPSRNDEDSNGRDGLVNPALTACIMGYLVLILGFVHVWSLKIQLHTRMLYGWMPVTERQWKIYRAVICFLLYLFLILFMLPCLVYVLLYREGVFGSTSSNGKWVPPAWCRHPRMRGRCRPPWWVLVVLGPPPRCKSRKHEVWADEAEQVAPRDVEIAGLDAARDAPQQQQQHLQAENQEQNIGSPRPRQSKKPRPRRHVRRPRIPIIIITPPDDEDSSESEAGPSSPTGPHPKQPYVYEA